MHDNPTSRVYDPNCTAHRSPARPTTPPPRTVDIVFLPCPTTRATLIDLPPWPTTLPPRTVGIVFLPWLTTLHPPWLKTKDRQQHAHTWPRKRTPARALNRASVSSSLTPIRPNAAVVMSYLIRAREQGQLGSCRPHAHERAATARPSTHSSPPPPPPIRTPILISKTVNTNRDHRRRATTKTTRQTKTNTAGSSSRHADLATREKTNNHPDDTYVGILSVPTSGRPSSPR